MEHGDSARVNPVKIHLEGNTSSMCAMVLLQTVCNPIVHGHRDFLLSGRTLHGVCPENWSGFNLCVVPPHNRVVPNFGEMEFTEFTKVFWSTPEKTEKTE